MSGHKGKKYKEARAKIEREKNYEIDEAIKRELQALTMDKKMLKKIKAELEVDFAERMTASETQRKVLEANLKEEEQFTSPIHYYH